MKNCYVIGFLVSCFSFTGYSQGTWSLIPTSPVASYRIDDVTFVNDSVGFFCNNYRVYKTSDRGNTWSQISFLDTISYYVRSVEFINSNIGFAGLIESAAPLPGNLYKTTDGGYNWTLLQNMQIQPADGICGMAHFDNRLVAVGTFSGPAWFYKTDDFGASWTKVDLSAYAYGLVDCYMISHDTILVSGMADSTNQQVATILKSVDGGNTWQTVYLSPTPYTYAWKMFLNPGGLGLASVEVLGSSMISVARTTDNGTTWATVYLDTVPFVADLGAIGMLNDSLGWVSEQGGYDTWETQDGGITWDHINAPITNGDRMVKIDSVTMIAVGSRVYKYEMGPVGLPSPPIIPDEISHSILVFPTPAKNIITIEAIAFRSTFGLIDILDEKGIRVMQVTRQRFPEGKSSFQVDVSKLNAGNYISVWHNNEKLMMKSFTVIR